MEQMFSPECVAQLQRAWAQGQTAMQDSLIAGQEGGTRIFNRALALGQAGAQHQLTCAEALSRSALDAMVQATTAVREQAEVCLQFPTDPLATAQRLLAGSLEASRKSLAIGAGTLQVVLQALGGAWGECAKAGQEMTEIVAESAHKVQGIAHQTITPA